jgi:hypothetical protein
MKNQRRAVSPTSATTGATTSRSTWSAVAGPV